MSGYILNHLIVTVILYACTYVIYSWNYWSCRIKERNSADKGRKLDIVVLIRWLIVPTFISLVILFLPMARLDGRNTAFSSVGDSIIRAAQTFSLDSSVQDVWDKAEELDMSFSGWERGWMAFILTFAPVLTVISAVTLFRLPKFWWAMLFPGKEICVFSDLNEKALMYASVMRRPGKEKAGRQGKKRKPYIVFCTDRKAGKAEKSDSAGQDLVLRQDISDIYILPWARKRTSFYLINPDGNVLVEMAGRLQKKYDDYASRIYCISNESLNEQAIDQMNRDQPVKTAKRGQGVKTDITFNDGRPASGSRELADTIRKSYIEIVSEPTRIVYHMLYNRNDIPGNDSFGRPLCLIDRHFLTQVLKIGEESNALKMINVLILGAGEVGEALARTMLWYCQMPGIGVSVTIADKEKEKVILGRVFRRNAEFAELLKQARYDDRVSLIPKGEVNLLSDDLETMLKTAQSGTGYHFVFIASGDDNQNYQLALRVRRYYLRHPNAWGYPRIHAVIWNQTLNAIVGKSSYIPLRGNLSDEPKNKMYYRLHGDKLYNTRCPVTLIGSMLDTVRTNDRLAYDALRYHTFYMHARKLEELCRSEVSIPAECYTGFYQNSQSDERSNFAAVLHGILKYRWFTVRESCAQEESPGNKLSQYRKELKERLAETEQIRWCIFKLIEGDAPVPEEELDAYMRNTPKGRDTDPIRGYHAALRTWDDLSCRQNKWKKSFAPNKEDNPNKKWEDYVDSTKNTVELSIGIEDSERLNSIGH